jgi:SM-20-related protein
MMTPLRWLSFGDERLVDLARATVRRHEHQFIDTAPITGGPMHRQSKVLWHYDYPLLRSYLIGRLGERFAEIAAVFPQMPKSPDIEVQLTAHADGQFYRKHLDNGDPASETRVLTFVWYFRLGETQQFTGGNLIIDTPLGQHVVEPTHNSLVVFPSGWWHEVLPTHMPNDNWQDARFTLNGWIRRAP